MSPWADPVVCRARPGCSYRSIIGPKTGKQMRKTLRRKYEDARDTMEELGDQANDWVDKGSEWAEKAKQRVAPFSKSFRR